MKEDKKSGMENKKEKSGFHFVYVTESDIENETNKLVSGITDEKISEYIFNGESLYETGGYGHEFGNGFYNDYITKSGVRATRYHSGKWSIGSDGYRYENGEFIIIEKPKSYDINWEDVTFPIVKNVNERTISDELLSIKPK
jgi:hypothetical protein